MNSTQPKPQVMNRLRKALLDDDPRKRQWAIVTLVKYDAHAGGLDTDKKADAPEVKEAVDPDEAERDEPDTSRAAARDRAPAENLEIPALLLEHLEHEPQSRNRQMIVRYLGERFYGPARATLNHIADDPGETDAIREAARIALESIPDNTADEVE